MYSPEPSEACVRCGVTICSSGAPEAPDGTGSLCQQCSAPQPVDHAPALAEALRGVLAIFDDASPLNARQAKALSIADSALAAYDAAKGGAK